MALQTVLILLTVFACAHGKFLEGDLKSVSSAPAEYGQPYLRVNTQKNFFNIGERSALFCEGQHLSGQMEWYNPAGERIQQKSSETTRVRIHVERRPVPEQGPTFLPLMFNNLTLEDTGIYTCKAGDLNATINVIVGVSSAPAEYGQPYLRVNTKRNFFNIGERKALFCEGQHLSGQMEWYNPAGEKIPRKSSKSTKMRMQVEPRPVPEQGPAFLPLMFNSLTVEDAGLYTCKAGDLNAFINVIVGEKVVIREKEVHYDAEANQSVELFCVAKGIPTPEIHWYKDNNVEPIVTNVKYTITYKSETSTSILKIYDLKYMDTGTYRCRATQASLSHIAEKIYRLRV